MIIVVTVFGAVPIQEYSRYCPALYPVPPPHPAAAKPPCTSAAGIVQHCALEQECASSPERRLDQSVL